MPSVSRRGAPLARQARVGTNFIVTENALTSSCEW